MTPIGRDASKQNLLYFELTRQQAAGFLKMGEIDFPKFGRQWVSLCHDRYDKEDCYGTKEIHARV